MPISKKSSVAAVVVLSVLAALAVAGGVALKESLVSKFSVNAEEEEQKILLVGTYKDVDGYPVSVSVSMSSPFTATLERTLVDGDYSYNVSGQEDPSSKWADLSSWAMEATGKMRIDEWCEAGGTISFQSVCAGKVSASKETDYGGGSYFVYNPREDGGEIQVSYMPVKIQVDEEDIS